MARFRIVNTKGDINKTVVDKENQLFRGELKALQCYAFDDKMPRIAWIVAHDDGEVTVAVRGKVSITIDKDGDGHFNKVEVS